MEKPWIPKVGESYYYVARDIKDRSFIPRNGGVRLDGSFDIVYYRTALGVGGGLFPTIEAAQAHADILNDQIKEWTTPQRFVYEACSFEDADKNYLDPSYRLVVRKDRSTDYYSSHKGPLDKGSCWARAVVDDLSSFLASDTL